MEAREYNRIDQIKSKRAEKNSVMDKTASEREWQLLYKKELEMIKREDRLENVARIAKAQDYKKNKILEKIDYDNAKS